MPGYELARELGAGSFGVVWLAVANQRGGGAAPAVDSCEMPTEVAIKMIAKQHLGNAAARAKVLEEARMLHRLRHPNIIRIFDVMETQSRILLVLEWYVHVHSVSAACLHPRTGQCLRLAWLRCWPMVDVEADSASAGPWSMLKLTRLRCWPMVDVYCITQHRRLLIHIQ